MKTYIFAQPSLRELTVIAPEEMMIEAFTLKREVEPYFEQTKDTNKG